MADIVAELKKLVKENKLIIGNDEVMKGLRAGKLIKVFLASNCPELAKEDILHYASLSGAEVVDTGIGNIDLGDLCKKPFAIAVLGLAK